MDSTSLDTAFGDVPAAALASVAGGAGFLDGIYKNIVFGVASGIAGPKLAQQMYGQHATAEDAARAHAAMKQFLARGNKLPKGVPNLFG